MRRPRTSFLLCFALAVTSCAERSTNAAARALVLVDHGQAAQAARLLEAALAQHPHAQRERRLLIRVYGVLGDFARAQAQSELLARELGPASPEPWLELGRAAELAHRFDQALALYDEASTRAPHLAVGPKTGGLRAAAWGEFALAEPRLVEALRRDARDATTWHALGLVRTHRGDYDGALAAYRAGLAAQPNHLENHVGLATLALLRHDPASALAEYDAIILLYPKFADARLGRSWALLLLGRLAEAEQVLNEAATLGADRRALERQRARLREERAKSAGTR